jgi:hypothetical protein
MTGSVHHNALIFTLEGPRWKPSTVQSSPDGEKHQTTELYSDINLFSWWKRSISDEIVTVGMSGSRSNLPTIELASGLSWWPLGYRVHIQYVLSA